MWQNWPKNMQYQVFTKIDTKDAKLSKMQFFCQNGYKICKIKQKSSLWQKWAKKYAIGKNAELCKRQFVGEMSTKYAKLNRKQFMAKLS